MKFFIYFVFTLMLGSILPDEVSAQKMNKARTKELVESKTFIFKVQTVMPSGTFNVQVTSDYDIKLNGDSLVTYLPYFGRAYTAPDYGQAGGINFTSTEFQYSLKSK
ncbi:MAG: DUF4251 domain-containing protein, partial [Flavisolibacter sp.]